MRVIGGTYRSRRLVAPRGLATRPTSDRLRETLFNVLAPRIEGAVFAGEAFTIAEDLPQNDPFRLVRDEFVASYEKANGQKPNIFAAHLWDAIALLKRAVPNALKTAKPGTPEFRMALRDELERGKEVYLNNGLSTMSPTDHNGYDERSAFLIKVAGGRFRLMESPR